MKTNNNRNVLENYTAEEIKNFQLEKMRYNNNSLSYILGFIGIACSVVATFISLNSFAPSNVLTVLKVLMNILILLVGFLATEKVKVYKKEYSYVMYVIGGVCALRIFWVPLQLIIYYHKFLNIFDGTKEGYEKASNACKSKLGVTVMGDFKDGKLVSSGYFAPNGYARAIIIIVFLAVAASCFITAGIINYNKSNKLNNYLAKVEKQH